MAKNQHLSTGLEWRVNHVPLENLQSMLDDVSDQGYDVYAVETHAGEESISAIIVASRMRID